MKPVWMALCALGLAGQTWAAGFSLTSSDIKPNSTLKPAQVFKGFGCEGGNVAPALSWSGEPAGTKSFAITVYDPDAPTGSGWWHWLVVNLPADTHSLPTASGQTDGPALPAGALQTRTDYGPVGYGGACPPPGDKPHRYIFTVWALKADTLQLGADASGAAVGYNLHANALGKASFTARYGR